MQTQSMIYFTLFVNRTDGRVFDGMWRNGLQHGKGTYTNAQGKVRKGVWEEGRRLRQQDDWVWGEGGKPNWRVGGVGAARALLTTMI